MTELLEEMEEQHGNTQFTQKATLLRASISPGKRTIQRNTHL